MSLSSMIKPKQLRYLSYKDGTPFAVVRIVKAQKIGGHFDYDYWTKTVQILDQARYDNFVKTISASGNVRWKPSLIGPVLTPLDQALL